MMTGANGTKTNGRELFQTARAQERRKSTGLGLLAVVFVYALVQVWLNVEVAERQSRVNTLRTDLTETDAERGVVESRLRRASTYGELAQVEAARGLVPHGAREEIVLVATSTWQTPVETTPTASTPTRALQAGLLGFVPLLGDEARAGESRGGHDSGR